MAPRGSTGHQEQACHDREKDQNNTCKWLGGEVADIACGRVFREGAMSDPTVAQSIELVFLGGMLGLFGQGSRAAVGLKTLSDFANASNPGPSDVFNAARLAISLGIGFLAGIAAALTYIMAGGDLTKLTVDALLGFAAVGYIGTDAIESFLVKYFDKGPLR
jgi:hypothetical protein